MKRTRIYVGLLLAALCFAGTTLINLSPGNGTQVTGVLSVANGGTGTASTLTGLVRGSVSAMTAAELSGAVTTSGSNATVLARAMHQNFATTSNPACTNGGGTNTFIGISSSSTTEGLVAHFMPTEAYTISRMIVGLAGNVPASETATFTLMDNQVATAVTCSIAAGSATCNDTSHSVATAFPGHVLDIKVNCAGGTTALTNPINVGIGYK
jgi:hypothetical protein